ncbi:patatin-like phospholipase family protein [Methylobacterium crusticola]|uniref:patatin-like phospholipase family protein n=1 Tax=Methylobacterium crusticola TaxID=1697972 RepID=UPI001396B52E|nr:patatin-like phospholipase family protein [Methylobacterium crusticola]
MHGHASPRGRRLAKVSRTPVADNQKGRRICLALQGGGSFGAFTWGVLDRLLEEDDLAIDTVSGAGAGSVNAVVMAAGLIAGGKPEARRCLDRFWKRSSETAPPDFGPAATVFTDMTSRWMSPYQSNPFNHDVLSKLLAKAVDFEALRSRPPFKLLVAATSVTNGTTRIFRETELAREMVLASTCLPMKAHAIEIAGTRYWDGGYSANPPLIPLVEASEASELLVVQIMPTRGHEQPRTAPDIVRRLEQVTFNGVLQREMATLGTMMELSAKAADEPGLGGRLHRLRLHHLSAEDHYPSLNDESTTDLDWRFLLRLRSAGRAAAETWLVGKPRDCVRHDASLRSVG